jgi:hypothetical protein
LNEGFTHWKTVELRGEIMLYGEIVVTSGGALSEASKRRDSTLIS